MIIGVFTHKGVEWPQCLGCTRFIERRPQLPSLSSRLLSVRLSPSCALLATGTGKTTLSGGKQASKLQPPSAALFVGMQRPVVWQAAALHTWGTGCLPLY